MKRLHRPDLYGWSRFDEARNIDFHSLLWVTGAGNLAVDPLPLTAHDEKHLVELGGAALVVITNSDHVRDVARFRELTGARVAGPSAERARFPVPCDVWLEDGGQPLPGVSVLELTGSKTPGELALLIADREPRTLVTGDLVRAHQAGRLNLLPDQKLSDRDAALASLARLAETNVDAVLVGDGWPVFRDGARALGELLSSLKTAR